MKNKEIIFNETREIIDLYNSGISSTKISKLVGLTRRVVLLRLKDKVEIRPKNIRNCRIFDLTKLLNEYNSGLSLSQLSKKYNMSITGVSANIKRQNGVIRPYNVNNNNWSFINEQKELFFYWLGWMLADGCVCERFSGGRKRGIISFLTVHKNDIHILNFFKDIIYKNTKIRKIKGKNCVRLDLAMQREIFNNVKTWGLIPNKTYEFKMTKRLNDISEDEFFQLFIGIVEGDGNVDCRKMKSKKYYYKVHRIRTTTSKRLISWIRQKLWEYGYDKRKINIFKHTKVCTGYTICGKDAIRLSERLNKCEYHLLNRKWDRLTIKYSENI